MKKCKCGCGKPIPSIQNRKFHDSTTCRVRYNTKMLLAGCLPASRIRIALCTNCGKEFAYWRNSKRKTCSQWSGTKCNYKQHSKDMKGNSNGRNNRIGRIKKNKVRMPHLDTYCTQSGRPQCSEYDKGFGELLYLDEKGDRAMDIDSGCWGHHYTGDCYRR